MKSITLLLFSVCLHMAEAQETEVVITIDSLSSEVYMLTGEGGNIGIYVGNDHVFMIDDQFDRLSEQIRQVITELSDKPIAFLFNTHMHGDHTGGNANFNDKNVTIIAHDNVRERVRDNQQKALDEAKITREYLKDMLPEVTFSNDITFYDGEEIIMGMHVHNAHTDGDALYYFSANNVLHMGDTYVAGTYPYIDIKSGGSVNGYIEAQKKALMVINEDTKIIPGHGRPSNKVELEKNVAMLEDLKSRVLKAISSGISMEEVKADTSLSAAYDETYGKGFIKPEILRETFYTSLKAH